MGSDGGKIRGARYFSVYVDEASQVQKEILDVVIRGFMATSANPMERVRLRKEQEEMLARGLITEEQMLKPPANKLVFSTTAFYQYNHSWERVCRLIEEFQRDLRIAKRASEDVSRFMFKGAALNDGQLPYRV